MIAKGTQYPPEAPGTTRRRSGAELEAPGSVKSS